MSDNNFRTVALLLRDYVSDTYALLSLTDAILSVFEPQPEVTTHDHESLVAVAKSDWVVTAFVRANQKINAIKRVREVTKCGLREAKEAVEDSRVLGSQF